MPPPLLGAHKNKALWLHCKQNFDPVNYLIKYPAFPACRQRLKQLLMAQYNLTDTEKASIIIHKVTITPHIIIALFKKEPNIWQKLNNT